jgi:hypothetical protein
MKGHWSTDQLLDAVGQLCNGAIGDADGRELDELLAEDPQARRLYTNYMWMHACLYAEGASLGDSGAGLENESDRLQFDPQTAVPLTPQLVGGEAQRLGAWLFIAAAIFGVAAFSSWMTHRLTSGGYVARDRSIASSPENSEAVARVTGTHNCRWRDPQHSVAYGETIYAGERIELAEGLAEIEFSDGATVLLEGPATFEVNAADRVALVNGRLAAVVPRQARGFRVHTSALDVFDVGTEFGLIAQESGSSEVHVFNGIVKADILDGNGKPLQRLELNAAEAARINALSTTVVEFPADDAQFIRNIMPSSGPHHGLVAEESFRYPEGPLEAQNGGFGWAGPWFTTSADEEAGPDSNRVKAGSLAVEGLVPVGNRAILTAQYNRIRRQLATAVGGVFDAEGLVENQDDVRLVGRDGKQVYVSFIQRVSKPDDGFYGVELHRGDGNGNRVLCVGNGAEGSTYGATSNTNVYGAKNLGVLGKENADANFFVIKIVFGVENRDTVEIFRNPESLRDEQACEPDAVLRGNFAFDRISIASFDGSKTHEVDEIRVGTHFLAVTGRWGNNGRLQRQIARDGDVAGGSRPESQFVWPLAASR